nr:hypothetical protein [Tanacetum cinerariifolium]
QAEIYNIDLDHSSKVLSMQEDDSEVQEAVEIVTTAKLMTEVVTAAATQVAAASTPIPAARPKTLTITAAPAVSTRRRKGVLIRDPEEELHTETPTVKDKEPQYIKRYHGIKKKPQTESKARKNMISYLKNTEGYKMEFFKGKTYDEILPIFQARFDANMKFLLKSREEMEKEDEEIIKSINETHAQKAAKRRKLSEEAQEANDLRRRLEIVQDEDDDVFVEAIPLAQKVPVVDYQIVVIDNKPKYKNIRADDTHQFYISFTTLLKNFDREDLETLWRIVKDRFSTSKPTNFSYEYLLLTLKTMFAELDEQDPIWRNQKSVHGVHTPSSDEDRLKLMELMVFLLQRNVCVKIEINAARLSKLPLSGKCDVNSQWKFLIHTILQSLSAKRTSWNEFSTAMASAVICLSKGQRFNFSKYIFDSLVRNMDSSSKFYMYPRFIQLIIQTNIADLSKHTNRYISPVLTQKVFANMQRVGKGFSGVETPLFETMLAVRGIVEEAEVQVSAQGEDIQEHAAEQVAADVVQPTPTSLLPSSIVIPSTPPHQSPCPPQPQDAEGSSHLFQQVLDTCSALVLRIEGLENANAA